MAGSLVIHRGRRHWPIGDPNPFLGWNTSWSFQEVHSKLALLASLLLSSSLLFISFMVGRPGLCSRDGETLRIMSFILVTKPPFDFDLMGMCIESTISDASLFSSKWPPSCSCFNTGDDATAGSKIPSLHGPTAAGEASEATVAAKTARTELHDMPSGYTSTGAEPLAPTSTPVLLIDNTRSMQGSRGCSRPSVTTCEACTALRGTSRPSTLALSLQRRSSVSVSDHT